MTAFFAVLSAVLAGAATWFGVRYALVATISALLSFDASTATEVIDNAASGIAAAVTLSLFAVIFSAAGISSTLRSLRVEEHPELTKEREREQQISTAVAAGIVIVLVIVLVVSAVSN